MPYTTIDRSSDYFRVKLYTGNGSTQSITFDESKAMQPDCTWIKVRNDVNVTLVHDVIRGTTKEIYTSQTNAEATDANGLTAFNSNGFSVGSAFGANRNTYTFVNWSWKANGAGVSNTAGTISSTVSANTTSGFSIVSYTGNGTSGATVGHGIGSTVGMILLKGRSFVDNWAVYHKSIGGTGLLELNGTGGTNTVSTRWNNTNAGATVFTLGNNSQVNGNGSTYIAYCFAEIKGYSKFGSFTGNGSTDGAFVYTGFKPAMIIFKNASTVTNWGIIDNKRDDDNVVVARLFPNLQDAESSSFNICDFTSNGFKLRTTDSQFNGSGNTMIYMAFASNPFVSSKGIPTTAR